MAELPSLVRVKRKRFEDPTPDLFLEERTSKRSSQSSQIWQFRLQQPHPSEQQRIDQARAVQAEQEATEKRASRREFRLAIDRGRTQTAIAGRKRKAQLDAQDIPIFVEATSKKQRFEGQTDVSRLSTADEGAKPSTAFKKPNASAKERQWRAETWKSPTGSPSHVTAKSPPDRMVDALQRFALEEAARDQVREKPRVTSIPKRPVQRYRDRHPEDFAAHNAQRQAQNAAPRNPDTDVDMDSDDDDYVYDTYVRTRDPVMLPTMDKDDSANDQIGYLVITEQDQPFWETYFEDEETDKEFDTDDEDENAEGYYGADYPEDEVASDDEFDRGAYGYRNVGSDDEQWDSDTGAFSDEGESMQNPWKKYPWMRGDKHTVGLSDDDADADD
ncbi:hypothetical protein BDV97DRAFT_402274 [Delphinella strobiligena]|nr:hypothetical protein BDV97DRAFT_402274 [Delphinella strobiligena]